MAIRQIAIVGTGLIGGSFGLALKANGFRGKLVGCDRRQVLAKAKRKRAIDVGVTDPAEACKGSDAVLLAAPVGGIIEFLKTVAPHISPDTLVTDVGSTKSEVTRVAQTAFGDGVVQRFLAGHPMAGKERSGIEFADADLFRGAVWFFTPVQGQDFKSKRIREFITLVKKTGARVALLNPEEHDELCAWISHVPQMLSTALASALVDEYGEKAPLLDSGGRALREMTRIAASPYSMWRDIAFTNNKRIAKALFALEQKIAHIRENLSTRELEAEFEQAHRLKRQKNRKNNLRS